MKKRGTGYHLFFNLLLSIRGIIRIVCSIAQVLFGIMGVCAFFFDVFGKDKVCIAILSVVMFVVATLIKWLYDELLHKLCPDDMDITLL